MHSDLMIDGALAFRNQVFEEPNDLVIDCGMQMPSSFNSDSPVQQDNAHGDTTDSDFSNTSQSYHERPSQTDAFLKSNVLQEPAGSPMLDSGRHGTPLRMDGALLEPSGPYEINTTVHDIPPMTESERLMFEEFTHGLVPPACKDTIEFTASHLHGEVNCNILTRDQVNTPTSESALPKDQTRQVQKQSFIEVDMPESENSSRYNRARSSVVNAESTIEPIVRERNAKASLIDRQSLRKVLALFARTSLPTMSVNHFPETMK
ncbi:MAG: hypothetical protein Q9160_002881 [Pyrenula sp. 1 TL-2023]